MKELKDEISRLHAENVALQQGYDAARLEIDHLRGATKMMDPAGEYPPLPRPFIFAHESGGVEWPDTFDATQMRAYADATCAMREQAAHAAVAGQCEDAIELLGKYKELCEEIKRGDSYHIGRIDAAISVLAQAAPQPAVQQGLSEAVNIQRRAFIRGWDERGMAHQLKGTEESDRRMKELADIYFPRAAPTQAKKGA